MHWNNKKKILATGVTLFKQAMQEMEHVKRKLQKQIFQKMISIWYNSTLEWKPKKKKE